ncbi:MAG TPA: hypothetical protein VGF71_15855 [Caulobacteraceae bacterium]
MSPGWSNFYFLIGSAAAGLIGLMFVVVTLTAGGDRSRSLRGAAIYLTPTIVHFAAVFSISAIIEAPGLAPAETATLVILIALAGFACCLRSAHGILRAPEGFGAPHWSDFWLYAGAPACLYLVLTLAAVGVGAHWPWASKAMAAVLLTLVLLAIRNAWDTITWIAPGRKAD